MTFPPDVAFRLISVLATVLITKLAFTTGRTINTVVSCSGKISGSGMVLFVMMIFEYIPLPMNNTSLNNGILIPDITSSVRIVDAVVLTW